MNAHDDPAPGVLVVGADALGDGSWIALAPTACGCKTAIFPSERLATITKLAEIRWFC